uniref:Uncharacterized protein n=1 Tax=Ovis aries TaxID=9940 RepID=A0AC11EFH8_SHEEP
YWAPLRAREDGRAGDQVRAVRVSGFQTKCIQVFVELNICEGKSERLPCFTLKWAPFDFKLYTEGNICRSPIAEAVFRKLVTDQSISDNWVIDSGAVSDWNVGRSPDPRAVSCLRNHGINTAHKARQVEETLFTFSYTDPITCEA